MKENHEVSDQKVDSSNPEQLTIQQSQSIDFRWAQEIQAQVDQAEQADWPIKDFFLSLQIPWVRITVNDVIKVTEWITRVIAHFDDNTSTSIFTTPEGVFMPVNNGEGKGVIQRLWGMDSQGMENIARQLKQRRAEKKASKQQAPEMSQPIERWDAIIQEERDKFYQEYTKNMHQQAMNWIPTPQEINNSNEQQEIQEKPLDMETVNQQFQELCNTIGYISYTDDNGIYRTIWLTTIKLSNGITRTTITIDKSIDKYTRSNYALINQNGKYFLTLDVYENGVENEEQRIDRELEGPENIAEQIKTIMDRYQEAQIKKGKDDEEAKQRNADEEKKDSEKATQWTYNNTHSNSDIQNA